MAKQQASLHVVCTWLRLLVAYHSPRLVQHLDRVLPGWEHTATTASATTVSPGPALSEQEVDYTSHESVGAAIDKAEAVAGEHEGELDSPEPVVSYSAGYLARNGVISATFLSGLFAGAVPVRQAAVMGDWAVLTGEKHAGKCAYQQCYSFVHIIEFFVLYVTRCLFPGRPAGALLHGAALYEHWS